MLEEIIVFPRLSVATAVRDNRWWLGVTSLVA
jgi:hypothetical protein